MVSLFNRVRSSTSKQQPVQQDLSPDGPSGSALYDEFGHVSNNHPLFSTPQAKAKDKTSKRARTLSAPGLPKDLPLTPAEQNIQAVPDGTFLSIFIPAKHDSTQLHRDYGYLGTEHDVILEIDDVLRIIADVGDEILSRGLTTPLLFSSQALDISSARVRSLVRSFLATCHRPSAHTGLLKWKTDLPLAGPHELGMLLRWGLARITRISSGQEVHGFVDWDTYAHWKDQEQALRFPPTHFLAFLDMINDNVRPLLENLFKILARLAAHAQSSGLTPIALSTLFGPLIFGLGLPSLPFSQTYALYLRSSHATEHLLLSYIRNIQVETQTAATGMPPRLKDWIRGYPVMIPPMKDLEKPRRGCKLIKVASFRRNVRLYTHDLVKEAASWAAQGDLMSRKEWQRVTTKRLPTKYTDAYRKRLDIPHSHIPSHSSLDSLPSAWDSQRNSTSSTSTSTVVADNAGFRSLTDFKWGEFEALGFSNPDTKKLEFDLTEGARNARTEKRNTMSWNDFSASGFARSDTEVNFPLSATLQFSHPISNTISQWPAHAEDINKKLKKTQKALPVFGWDTTPVAGMEWVVEEGFADCWADLLLSSGWMDREEGTFREANWALVEFSAIPNNTDSPPLGSPADPRTSSQWFLFEEFVPREYRDSLNMPPKKRRTFFSNTLGGNKTKAWKPSPTVNGKPNNGRPRSPSAREAEFDALIRASTNGSETKTKVLSLSGRRSETAPHLSEGLYSTRTPAIPYSPSRGEDINAAFPANAPIPRPGKPLKSVTYPQTMSSPNQATSRPGPTPVAPPATPSKDKSRTIFKMPGSSSAKRPIRASEYDPDIEFETRTASDSSGELGRVETKAKVFPIGLKHSRRQSKDDAWVDILVADSRRMAGQDGTMNRAGAGYGGGASGGMGKMDIGLRTPKTSLSKSKSDPELAREELSRGMGRGSNDLGLYRGSDDDGDIRPLIGHGFRGSIEDDDDDFDASIISHPQPAPAIHVRSPSDSSSTMGLPYDSHYQVPGSSDIFHNGHQGPRSEDEADDEGEFHPVTPMITPPTTIRGHPDESIGPVPQIDRWKTDRSPSPVSPVQRFAPPIKDEAESPVRKNPLPIRSSSGGVSSLIEMYGKKDAAVAASSRIPIRSPQPLANHPLPILDKLTSSPSNSESPPLPSPPVLEPTDRALNPSPGRYVHGAPLHNVLEELSEPESP